MSSRTNANALYNNVQSRFKHKDKEVTKTAGTETQDEIVPDEERHKAELIGILQTEVSPTGFEKNL